MTPSDGRVAYSQLTPLDNDEGDFRYIKSGTRPVFTPNTEDSKCCSPALHSFEDEYPYHFTPDSDYLDDKSYSSADCRNSLQLKQQPEVNLKIVLSGIFYILMDCEARCHGLDLYEGWLNMPVGLSMEQEIYKAANALRSYWQAARLDPEKSIPSSVLKGARGLAVITVAKAGMLLTYKLGTGLVVARRSDGSWSAPSAILSLGLGWGAQIGGELTDFIIVLHGLKAVKTFSSRMHFSLGAGVSAAAGPVGRVLEADLRAGDGGSGMCYTYSCSKGAFVGISLEGNIVVTRMDTNLEFYGDPYLTTADILLGTVDQPRAAEPLYRALNDIYSRVGTKMLAFS